MSETLRRSRTSLVALLLGTAVWVVSCENPLAPELCGPLPDQTVAVGGTIDVAVCFRDPNGEALDLDAFSSDPDIATFEVRGSTVTISAVSPGTAVVTVVATDPTGLEARQTFQVIVPDRPPTAVGTIDDRELMVGDSAVIDIRGHFAEPDGQPLRYSAGASDPNRVAVSLDGTVVTVVAVAKGTVVVTVTATDLGGLAATQSFEVTVPNRPPVAVDSIAAREVMVDHAHTLDVSPFFADPDGDPLTYAAAASDEAVVEAAVDASTFTLNGLAKGAATVTVTATDDEALTAEQSFTVTVPNRPPAATGTIPSRTIYKTEADTLDLAAYFADPDADPLAWAAEASDARVVALDLAAAGGRLVVTPLASGETLVTVTATDPDGLSASQSFTVTVPNRPPAAIDTIPSRTLYKSEADTLDLTAHFSDPDGDPLTWAASVSNGDVVALEVSSTDGTLILTPLAEGEAVVTATATDPDGLSASQSFTVTVPNRRPVVTDPILSRTILKNEADTVALERHFSDPDGDPLTWDAEASDNGVVSLELSPNAGTLVIAPLSAGVATVTVTATDDEGLAAFQSFTVTVPNRPPVATDTIPSRMLYKSEVDTPDLTAWFSDPDGDPLAWAAEASDPRVVALDLSASEGTLVVTPLAGGETVVTVTATDTDGLAAFQSFTVTVSNRPPVATETIPSRTLYKSEADTLDLTAWFSDPDGDPLTWATAVSDASVVALAVSGSDGTLILTPLSEGEAVVTVTATDPEGLTATQSFTVAVPNRGPVATDSIPAQTLYKRQTAPLDLSRHFNDPDDDALQVEIASSDSLVATATASGTTLTVRAGVTGEATLTVTVIDPEGLSARQSFAVTVLNRAPAATTPIPAQTLARGPSRTLDLGAHFSDPDGDTLHYAASSSNPWVARVRVDGSDLILTAWSVGEVEVTVTATDPDSLTARQTFAVTVDNRAPVAAGTFPDLELGRGERLTLPIDRYFSDPDRDDLTYTADTSDPGVATARTRRNLVTLTGVSDGLATLTLTATDPQGLAATQTSRILVAEQGDTPLRVGDIPAQTVAAGRGRTLVVSGHFMDPNGDPLRYTATTENAGIARAAVSGARVTLTGMATGQTTLSVTASDPDNNSAALSTPVTVVAPGHGPVAAAPIPDQSVEVGRTRTVSVADHFQDPAGGSLGFAAASSDPAIVTAAASERDVDLTGVAEGGARVTVTATDPEGRSVRQAFSVTIQPRGGAPVAVGVLGRLPIEEGGVEVLHAPSLFRDPDDQDLSYSARTADATIATASATGNTITVRGVAAGSTTLAITATDPSGLTATQSAEVAVSARQHGPEAEGTIPDDSLMVGDEISIGIAPYFGHPGGLSLTYSAGTSNSGIATAATRGDIVEVVGQGRGTATITVIASDPNGRTAVQQFLVHVWRIDTGFEIQLGFTSGVGPKLESAMLTAAATWEAILRDTEFPDVVVNDVFSCRLAGIQFEVELGYLDDLAIAVGAGTGDGGGTLALATTCARRVPGAAPALRVIVFDNADVDRLAQAGNLVEVAMHEIAHVLGIGLSPDWYLSIANPSDSLPDADTHFPGFNAVAAFNAAGGASYTGGKVPVENGGDDAHWRESVMGPENMTPRLTLGAANPVSAITIRALADLGYRVNARLADRYVVSPAAAAVAEDAPTIDLRNDYYRGPVIEIDGEGNTVRVVPGERGELPGVTGAPAAAATRADSTVAITIGSRP